MKKYTLYIGLNDKETKTQDIATNAAKSIVEGIFLDIVGGCTIYRAEGVYTHENGDTVAENTFVVDVFDVNENDLLLICE